MTSNTVEGLTFAQVRALEPKLDAFMKENGILAASITLVRDPEGFRMKYHWDAKRHIKRGHGCICHLAIDIDDVIAMRQ